MTRREFIVDDSPRDRARQALAAAFGSPDVRISDDGKVARVCLGIASGGEVWLSLPIRIEHRLTVEKVGP